MDNESDKAIATVARLFSDEQQQAADGSDRRWRWRRGTILFPEGRCCFCTEAVRSNDRLWVVDSGWLRGQLNVAGETAVFEKPEHPHSGTDGGLCLGDSDNAESALFFGVNPADPLRRDMSIPKWYESMFGHKCSGEVAATRTTGLFAPPVSYEGDDDDGNDGRCPDCCRCCDSDCCPNDETPCACGCEGCGCESAKCGVCQAEFTGEIYYIQQRRTGGSTWLNACESCADSDSFIACGSCGTRIAKEGVTAIEGVLYCYSCERHQLRRTAATIQAAVPTAMPTLAGTITSTQRVIVDSMGRFTVMPLAPADDIDF